MRRATLSQWLSTVVLSGALVAGCGGSGTTKKKDASTGGDGSTDTVMVKKDGPVATDTPLATDTPRPTDAIVKLDTTGTNPDTPIPTTDVPKSDTSGTGTIDTPAGTDIPVGNDAPVDAPPSDNDGGTAGGDGGTGSQDVPVSTGGVGGAGGAGGVSSTGGATGGSGGSGGPDAPSDPAVITGWPTGLELDFGQNPCGGPAATALTFTLTNSGTTAARLQTAELSSQYAYTVAYSNAERTIGPNGGQLVVSVQAPAIPATSEIPKTYNGVLSLQTNILGDDIRNIALTQSAKGAILAWETVDPNQVGWDFGSVSPGASTAKIVRVTNTGNVKANITLATQSPFSVSPSTSTEIGISSAENFDLTFTSPNTAGLVAKTVGMTVVGSVALCQPLPDPLMLTGTSLNGAINLSRSIILFETRCGENPTEETLIVSNTGTIPMTWTGTLGSQNPKFSISPTTQTLAIANDAGTSSSSTVTVQATAPGHTTASVTDTITFGTNITNDPGNHTVDLVHNPLGANLDVSPSSMDFGMVPIAVVAQQSAPQTLTIQNNAFLNSPSAVVTLSLSGAGAAYFEVVPTTLTIAAQSAGTAEVVFKPGTSNAIITSGTSVDLTATLNWQVAEPNCGTGTGTVGLQGRATRSVVSIAPTTHDFGTNGLVNCGATADPFLITISNTGTATYDVTSVVLSNTASYVLEGPPVPFTVPPGDPVYINVVPNPIPDAVSPVPSTTTFSGTIVITTNAVDDPPHEVSLNMGARGAIISNSLPLSTTNWTFMTSSTAEFQVYIRNEGNADVVLSLENIMKGPGENVDVFSMAQNNDTAVAGDGSSSVISSIIALFTPIGSNKTWNTSGTLTLTGPLCQPLPPSWNAPTINLQGIAFTVNH